MSEKGLRKSMAVLPMSTTMELTALTARQIRYYETHQLIQPKRSASNQRLFSLDDIDRLLEIKELLAMTRSMTEIKQFFAKQDMQATHVQSTPPPISDAEVIQLMYQDILAESGLNKSY